MMFGTKNSFSLSDSHFFLQMMWLCSRVGVGPEKVLDSSGTPPLTCEQKHHLTPILQAGLVII